MDSRIREFLKAFIRIFSVFLFLIGIIVFIVPQVIPVESYTWGFAAIFVGLGIVLQVLESLDKKVQTVETNVSKLGNIPTQFGLSRMDRDFPKFNIEWVGNADEIKILAISAYSLINGHTKEIEKMLRRGITFTFILIDPQNEELFGPAGRIFGKDNPDAVRNDLIGSLRVLCRFWHRFHNQIKVKFIDFIPPFSLMYVNRRSQNDELLLEIPLYDIGAQDRFWMRVVEDDSRLFEQLRRALENIEDDSKTIQISDLPECKK